MPSSVELGDVWLLVALIITFYYYESMHNQAIRLQSYAAIPLYWFQQVK